VSYVTVQQVRDAGLTVAMIPDDADVQAAIDLWQAFIERATRQWFEERPATLDVDGTDSDTIHFPVPVISVSAVYLNNSADALDTSYYRVYNNRTAYPDDRKNPRLKLIGPDSHRDIFNQPLMFGSLRFRKGRQNQRIIGTWGYTEEDGSVPLLIQRALIKLVIEKIGPIIPGPAGPGVPPVVPTGLLVEERTDDHSRKWQAAGGSTKARPGGLLGITNDPEVLRIIQLYKAPTAMATPAHWSGGSQ
jgi:hypothetical protein